MNKTSIEWTDYTWNPVTGCNKISQGCKNCYAETIANRFWGARMFTDVMMHEDRLQEPITHKKKWAGKKVFVCSMSDLFHESVSFQFIDCVFSTMAITPNATFQILTKRPERVLQWSKNYDGPVFPLPNVWIGTSCENQATADERIPLLLQIPAAVRFLSCEPLLGPIDLEMYLKPFIKVNKYIDTKGLTWTNIKIHWVIAGGESGYHARPMHPDWVRSLRDQCAQANVPFFFKQWGEYVPGTQSDSSYVIAIPGWPTQFMKRAGKSKAGNMLDGVQHLKFPL